MNTMTDEQRKVVECNHNLIYSFLNKHNLPIDEWYGIVAIGLCKAAMTFNDGTSKFSTYAYSCMHNEVRKEMKKCQTQRSVPQDKTMSCQMSINKFDGENIGTLADVIPSNVDIELEAAVRDAIKRSWEELSDKNKIIIKLFLFGYKQREIAEILGTSSQYISTIKRKFVKNVSV